MRHFFGKLKSFQHKNKRRRRKLRRRLVLNYRLYLKRYRICSQLLLSVILQGNGDSEMFSTDVNAGSWQDVRRSDVRSGRRRWGRTGMSRRRRRRQLASARMMSRSGVMTSARTSGRVMSRSRLMSRSWLMLNGFGSRSRMTVGAAKTALSHRGAAKSKAQANRNHCCKKFLHGICLLVLLNC